MTAQTTPFAPTRYQQHTRRLLRDMHIPDWDPGFLADYNPDRLAQQCADAGLDAVMLYAKSHVGLCNYPTSVGKMHGNLQGRDVLGELNDACRARGLSTMAYQSITFDNWAATTHPDWAQIDVSTGRPLHDRTRYGVCCPNNADYRAYELAITEEILSGYDVDGLWLDMIFFLAICACAACSERLQREDGIDIPTTVDWTDPAWATFQEARRRWLNEWTRILIDRAHELKPGIAVTHNLANALSGWRCGQSLASGTLDTYTSLDLYGDRFEHLVVNKLAQHLSRTQPAELMVSVGIDLIDHVTLKSTAELTSEGLAATATGSAFIVIDGIDPAGSELPGNFEVIRDTFAAMALYADLGAGTPLEDIAIYFSDNSFMDFADNGTPAGPPPRLGGTPFPHVQAARGVARALTEAHIPFGVLSESDLDLLPTFRAVVLPDISRMTAREVEAIRAYVAGGGRVYASGYTSLVETTGTRHEDFMLADVFGVSFTGEEDHRVAFMTPQSDEVRQAIRPQEEISEPYNAQWGVPYVPQPLRSSPRTTATTASTLATLTLPYGGPAWGSVDDTSWASIHSAPPWERTEHSTLVRNEFGSGVAVYSTFVLERSAAAANRALLTSILRDLVGPEPAFSAEARSGVWLNAYDQTENGRILVTIQHYGVEQPAPAEPVLVTLRAPSGRALGEATAGPGLRVVSTETGDGGTAVLQVELTSELGVLYVDCV